MNKFFFTLTLALSLSLSAYAQLPSNPWVAQPPSPNDGDFGNQVQEAGPATAPNAPEYFARPTGGDILPVDPWSRARDRTSTRTWRGSGQHGKLNYVGEATTYGTASGQEMIAPEVNRHNLLTMTDHLRNMGYKIPDSYDENIKNAPRNYKGLLRESYDTIFTQTDPLSGISTSLMNGFEAGTGLDIENLLFNTMDVLSTD